ncbi:MAG: Chromosome partition protein Smc [Candidatus Omnitrophica bacterium ADurb.Bin292]|mgnify:FL=1|jgi:chromosome segregation protein|nr:MAG: Chromosome partition protein Smc [Candidatus Omnitrophica bacterium ADurb.Bin292]HPW76510.1 chromosome segregation protein SMC [Candidatus Omnitrophota bacterium]HQB11759.1 chromosome segregation protein SMC [Candidatus Omnitrophota bacterium]
MRLKKLEIVGFKSFADKTDIFFDKGVTCIVGPNGCGKSNVSDSIRWVLGERSAKILRGSSMEDVIFNGTEVRKPLAFAEVSLTIDNSDHTLPIEYNDVTIARRLYRTGESEYLLNKTVCRLKDLQDLILDTGIGSSSYSMIEQGRIDYILKADPEERRFLIEEAAGIAKFKAKKDESIRKLERTEDNLKRLNDIVLEVQKNIQYAERQAKRAEKYKVELERLKSLEIKRAFLFQGQIATQTSQLNEKIQFQKNELGRLETVLSESQAQLAQQEISLRDVLDRYQQKESERYGVLSKIETNEQKSQFLREKKIEIAQQRGQVLQEQDQVNQSLGAGQQKKEEMEKLLKTQETDLSSCQDRLTQVQTTLDAHESSIQACKEVLEQCRHDFLEASQATIHTRNEYQRHRSLKENLDQQCKRGESETSRVSAEIAVWDQRLTNVTQLIETNEAEYRSLEQKLSLIETQLSEQTRTRTAQEEKIRQIQLSIKEKDSRLRVLTEVDEHQETSFHDFIAENEAEQQGLVRDLKTVLKVAEGKEWALDIALGHFVRSVIVQDLPTAKTLAEKLKARRSFTTGILLQSFLPSFASLPDAEAMYQSAGFSPLLSFVSPASGWEEAVSRILGNIYVAEQFPFQFLEAFLQGDTRAFLITQDGFLFTPDKKIFFWNNTNRMEFAFSRSGEVARIRQEIDQLRLDMTSAEGNLEGVASGQRNLLTEAESSRAKKTELLIARESLETEKKNIKERLAAFQQEMDLTQSELQDMVRESQEIFGKETHLEAELRQKEAEESRVHGIQMEKENELQSLLSERENVLLEVQQVRSQTEQYQQGIHHLQDSMRLIAQHIAKDNDRLVFLGEGLARFDAKDVELAEDESRCHGMAQEYQSQLREVDLSLELLRQEKTEAETRLEQQNQAIHASQEKQKQIQEAQHQISLQIMDLDYQFKNVAERLLQRYRLNLTDLDPQAYPFTPEELQNVEEDIARLQTKVDSLGTVNLLAIEEYQELKQRYDFLVAQKKDLEDARDSLMEAIRKINRTTKQLFEDTFAQVQVTFREYYQTLFRGGDARLTLIDEEHPLDSGIDIVVRPPGKKLQNMSLLSGGEKALTAVALLFALFKIRPSPFCLLDEVDAPLDEANIDRFLAVLRSFVDTTQFLIITHNRKTIAMGDSLYGVTMEEPGVSKIVSVKVRSGDESVPGEDLHPSVATEEAMRAIQHPQETTGAVTS